MKLQALIGINHENKLTLFVNPWGSLNSLGPMHLRGKPLPVAVQKFLDHPTDELAVPALDALHKYFADAEKAKVQPRVAPPEPAVRKSVRVPIRSKSKPAS